VNDRASGGWRARGGVQAGSGRAPTGLAARTAALSLLAAVAGALALAASRPGSSDDAFVLLVYAREWRAHGLLAYDPSQGALDGFTSFLDLVLKTGAISLWASDPVRTLWVFTGAVYLASLVALAWAGARFARGRPACGVLEQALAIGALALAPGLAEGTSYQLETPLFAALIALSSVALPLSTGRARDEAWAALLGLALVATRPEALPVVAALLIARARSGPGARGWALPAWLSLSAGAALAHRLVFGAWAPNAFYAKRSSSWLWELRDGLDYLADACLGQGAGGTSLAAALAACASLGGVVLVAFVPAGTWVRPGHRLRARAAALASFLALAAVALAGGDGYAGLRLLAPAFLWALLALAQLALLGRGPWRGAALALLATVVGARAVEVVPGAPLSPAAWRAAVWSEEDFACERSIARTLASALGGESLAHRHFQQGRWFAPDLALIDLTGLNDREIAHTPTRGPVAFGRSSLAPALRRGAGALLLSVVPVAGERLSDRTLRQTLADGPRTARLLGAPPPEPELVPELCARYRPATLSDVCGPGSYLNVLVRDDLAARFRALGFEVR